MFFDSWYGLGRVLLVGTLAYLALVAVLRVSGKRTLAKMNAFDLVVTVALGSTLSSVLLSQDVALAEGVLAFALLAFLQFSVAWLVTRFNQIETLVKAEPRMLLYQGQFLRANMRDERVTEEEIRQALRSAGQSDPAQVRAVILETDGQFSVLS